MAVNFKNEIIHLDNFPLADIEKTFNYSTFQRTIIKQHVKEIARSINKRNFYDDIIKVVKTGNNHYDVIDGQHRLEALKMVRDEYGVTTFNLIVYIFNKGDARNIYRRLNLGKKLTLGDHLKAIDDGKVQFFNDLRESCEHDKSGTKSTFVQAVHCIHYARTGLAHALQAKTIDDFLNRTSPSDYKMINLFNKTIFNEVPDKAYSPLYWFSIFRNLYRVSFENELSENKIKELINLVEKNKEIKRLADEGKHTAIIEIYHYLTNKFSTKHGLGLKKHKDISNPDDDDQLVGD